MTTRQMQNIKEKTEAIIAERLLGFTDDSAKLRALEALLHTTETITATERTAYVMALTRYRMFWSGLADTIRHQLETSVEEANLADVLAEVQDKAVELTEERDGCESSYLEASQALPIIRDAYADLRSKINVNR